MRPSVHQDIDDLHRSYRPALMSFFLRRLRNPAEAEDMTQEVLLKLAAVDRTEMQNPAAYIFGMAANLLRDRARREQVRSEYRGELALDEAIGIDSLDPARIMSAHQSVAILEEALTQLPRLTRTIFILHRIENVQRREIARAHRISEAAVDRHLAKAMSYLVARVRGEME